MNRSCLYDIVKVSSTDAETAVKKTFEPLLSKIYEINRSGLILENLNATAESWDATIQAYTESLKNANTLLSENIKNLPDAPPVVGKTRIDMLLEAKDDQKLAEWMNDVSPEAFFSDSSKSIETMIDVIDFGRGWLEHPAVQNWLVYVLCNLNVTEETATVKKEVIGALKDLLVQCEMKIHAKQADVHIRKVYHLTHSLLKDLAGPGPY